MPQRASVVQTVVGDNFVRKSHSMADTPKHCLRDPADACFYPLIQHKSSR